MACSICGGNHGAHHCFDRQKAIAATGASQQGDVAIIDWAGALARRWERRLAENSGATRDELECGKTLQLRECLDELRAEIESAPTDLDQT